VKHANERAARKSSASLARGADDDVRAREHRGLGKTEPFTVPPFKVIIREITGPGY